MIDGKNESAGLEQVFSSRNLNIFVQDVFCTLIEPINLYQETWWSGVPDAPLIPKFGLRMKNNALKDLGKCYLESQVLFLYIGLNFVDDDQIMT